MSDLGDMDSPLPSYPTLSPSSSDAHFESESLFDSPPSSTHSGMGIYDVPTTNTSTGMGRHDEAALYENIGYPGVNQLPVSYAVGNPTHFIGSPSPPASSSATNTNFPIYATVKKKTNLDDSLMMRHSDLHNNVRQRTTSGSPSTESSPNVPPPLGHTPLSGDSTTTLQLRSKHLEQLCGKLSQEKNQVEDDFGRQRKSFMNHMGHLDAQLTLCKQTVDKYGQEIRELSKQVLSKDEELKNVAIVAGITEATIRESFDADRVKYEEEIASLAKIVSVQSQDTNQAMQQERERWHTENATLRSELEQLERGGMVLSPHPTPSRVTTPPPTQLIRTPSPDNEDANLELLMIKAAEDTKLLRSVVVPLEEEIQSLKGQLSIAESKLAEKEEVKGAETSTVSLIDFDTSLSFSEQDTSRNLTSPMPADQRELQHQLSLARSACSDLEMHTSQLNMQKSILQSELKSLSDQLTKVTTDFEVEKLNCVELKKTWELANDHFIVAQDKLKQEIYRLHQKLERGEAVSPMREILIEALPSPTIVERASKHVDVESSRTHKRSWSTDEVSEFSTESPLETPSLDRLKSASWSSLQKPSDAISEREEALSNKTESLENELSIAQSELVHLRKKCANYEKQLPRVQEQLMKDLNEKESIIDKIKAENDKFRAHVMRQQQQHETLCRQIDDLKEEMKTRIETFQVNEKEYKGQLRVLRDKFTEIKQDTQREIVRMSEERRGVYQQLEVTKEEYNILKIVQGEDVATYQAQLADLKQKLQDVESKNTSTASQLSNAKDQLRQVREMMTAERTNKERATSQLEMARTRIDELNPLIAKVEAERIAKEEALTSRSVTEKKSRDFINEQRDMLEKLNGEKERAQSQVSELLIQVSSLKHKLNHTEETQKDFVELSQSLQIKLANIEEESQKSQELQESFLSSPSTPSST